MQSWPTLSVLWSLLWGHWMTESELIDKIANAIAEMEGYGKKGSLAWRNANPGNIRRWRGLDGEPYPQRRGYVDFVAWARGDREKAEKEGWRVLRRQVFLFVSGVRTNGRVPSLREMFHVYAPRADGNDPDRYAKFVAGKLGIDVDVPLKEVLDNAD